MMIKNKLVGAIAFSLMIGLMSCQSQAQTPSKTPMIYDIQINALEGGAISLADFKGKKMLFVNVASKCGFTGQYEDLQSLHEQHGDKLVIIGVPCNQFGGQEPGSPEEIATFCERNYGVTFLMTEKVDVKGESQHPLYQWLTQKSLNGKEDSSVKWNFEKYLVGAEGELLDSYSSMTNPLSKDILKWLE